MEMTFAEKYKIIRQIGEGSFSEVIEVQNEQGHRFAAKKLTKPYQSLDEVMDVNEVRAARALEHHPNVIGIREICFDASNKSLYLISDLFDMNMYDFIKNRKRCMSEVRVQNYMYQLVCGLNHLHRHEIFHRDIKPENILIKIDPSQRYNPAKAEVIQLADLGSSTSTSKPPPHSAYISTRWYRAPESLITAGFYTSKIDIWALGCVFYELLTLNPLFPGDNELDQLNKIHSIVGVPSKQMYAKFRHTSIPYNFPKRQSTGLHMLVPGLSQKGLELLRSTLQYLPEIRISSMRLINHNYFDDLRPRNQRNSGSHSKSIGSMSNSSRSGSSMMSNQSAPTHTSGQIESASSISNKPTKGLSERHVRSTASLLNKKLVHDTRTKERLWGMNPGKAKNYLIQSMFK